MMSLNKVCILILFVSLSYGRVPSIRLCGDPKCETIISIAKTVIHYQPSELNHVAFRGNTPCRVLSKSIGENSDIWEIEVQGRRGYAPKKMIMEQKILIKAADLIQVGSVNEPEPKDTVIEDDSVKQVTEQTTEPTEDQVSDQANNVDSAALPSETPIIQNTDNVVIQNSTDAEVQVDEKKYEPSQQEKELIDEDDEDEEYYNRLPVEEPLAIKRDMYKTGDSGEQSISNDTADVHLEVVGLDANQQIPTSLEQEIRKENENEIGSTEKVQTSQEETFNTDQQNSLPEFTFQEQTENWNNVNDQPPIESIIPAKNEEYQNSDEQIDVFVDNKVEEVLAINQVEPTDPTSIPIAPSDLTPEPVNIEQTQTFEDNSTLDILSTQVTASSTDFESASTTPSSVLADAQELTSEEKQFDNSKQEQNEIKQEYFENNNNQTPVPNSFPDETQQFLQPETVGDTSNEYYTPKTSDLNIPEPIVTVDQTQPATDGLNEQSTEPNISTTEIIVDQAPEVIENKVLNEQIHDASSDVPPSPPPPALTPQDSGDNDVRTDDIFSPHFRPDSPSVEISENDDSNWYDGILIFMEDSFARVKKLFDRDLSEKSEKEESVHVDKSLDENGYCESLQGENCPKTQQRFIPPNYLDNLSKIKDISSSEFVNDFLTQLIARADLVMFLIVTASTLLFFIFIHYCCANSRRESSLIAQLNTLERKLILSQKECSVAKADLAETARKLNSIADKSFGADDMVKQYEAERNELLEQIASLEKELETAAEAGLELNKMVQELLSNQSGSDSIINSVEELQHQLNEQEANMIYINNLLAEKSRENSELQVLLSDTNQKFGSEIQELLSLNKQLETTNEKLKDELNEKIGSLEAELKAVVESKSSEISILKEKYDTLKKKYDEAVSKWRSSTARAEALEDTLKKMETFNGKDDIKLIIEATHVNAKCIALKKESESLSDRLDAEIDCKNRLQEQIKELNDETTRLRAEFNQHEKDKLEAETRLEVLSNYFKEKESQLQKELNVKEALFMKQQGESTTTVDRIRSLQEDIQKLTSQNDALRAEIEAQSQAHKAQINAAEVRAHDSWLAAKQAERRLEEARSEASILRKKLTSLTAFNGTTSESNFNRTDGFIPDLNAPSPIHMESPSSPVLPPLNLPPPPLIPAPMYSGNIPPFMPPPPLPLPNEMRPAPLGRLMSPPPPDHRFVANYVEPNRYEKNRYSPDDYPTDLYETETDFSPPRSPPRSPDFYRGRNYRNYSPEVPIKKKSNRKGSSSDKSSILDSDEWDRRTF